MNGLARGRIQYHGLVWERHEGNVYRLKYWNTWLYFDTVNDRLTKSTNGQKSVTVDVDSLEGICLLRAAKMALGITQSEVPKPKEPLWKRLEAEAKNILPKYASLRRQRIAELVPEVKALEEGSDPCPRCENGAQEPFVAPICHNGPIKESETLRTQMVKLREDLLSVLVDIQETLTTPGRAPHVYEDCFERVCERLEGVGSRVYFGKVELE